MAKVPQRETLTVEFKSDAGRLDDRDLLAAVVCLANTEGGELYIGVEDNGLVSGLHPSHKDESRLSAFIANRTVPPVAARVERLTADNGEDFIRVDVPKSRQLVATSDGMLLRRRLRLDGMPECIPFYPHEFVQRASSVSGLDVSAQVPAEGELTDLDPLERTRIRNIIRRSRGEAILGELTDEELDGALGLTTSHSGTRRPTIAGILVAGFEESIRRLVPAHEAAFQVLSGTDVPVNEFSKRPLLSIIEDFFTRFEAINPEEEFEDGLFRISVPKYDKRAFREGFINALVHRDYTKLGAVHVRFESESLSISNPGGFVEGVTLDNILIVEPRPRNPLLADILKRIGLAERTGRGVDRIFEGMLRFGRPEPDYSRSTSADVVLRLSSSERDTPFMAMILEEEKRIGKSLPVDALILLSRLKRNRRATSAELMSGVLSHLDSGRGTLERLVEADLIEAHGTGKGRTYTLSPKVYQKEGEKADYVRQAGFSRLQQEQMILQYLKMNETISRKEAAELCRISPNQASHLLRSLSTPTGPLEKQGEKRGARYALRE